MNDPITSKAAACYFNNKNYQNNYNITNEFHNLFK
jgi:hypothetical protein